MGPGRVELPTLRLSGVRSNQLSYEPEYSISDFRFSLLFKSKILNRKPTILLGSPVITLNLKKSNKKNR